MPCILTTDLEKALILSIKQEFPESKIHGCYFHLMQAIRKNLDMSILFSKMELLTQISHSEINDAITYIQTFLKDKVCRNFGHTLDKLGLSDSTLYFGMFPWVKVLRWSTELKMRLRDTIDV
ncbi:LOW QUALITY PROTEIN: hypothetical protein HZS_2708 [Henneguya salminicola]|nr:LOW QUALITY PROTEIN: hypothetical protein HZS_2708 [Henneguya salminicola]